MSTNLDAQLEKLPQYLGGHVGLCGVALALSLGISLPLSLRIARSPRLRLPVVTAAGIVQTIPSLALLALMVPALGAFGFWPALVALVLYGMLPIVRNTVTGITNVQPDLVEAATGLGMTPRQVLLKVELPLALPVIVAGVRTSAVWLVGMATLATPVGQTTLGNYVFGGLQTRNWTAVLVGCAAAAILSVSLDLLLALMERGVQLRRRSLVTAGAAGLLMVFGGGASLPAVARAIATPPVASASPQSAQPSLPTTAVTKVRVGSKTFTEQYILAALIEDRLSAAGVEVERAQSLGSTIAFDALTKSDIDVYVEYTGTLWANAMKREDVAPGWHVQAEVSAYLAREHGIRALGTLGFENTYALALPRARAEAFGIRTVSDLVAHAPELALGSDFEFFSRPEWARLQQTYGLAFAARRSFDSTFMYEAVRNAEVDVITAFSSDGRIAAYDLSVLVDDRGAFPPYEAILLLSPRVANDERIVAALRPLIGAIGVDGMREANLMVDRDEDKRSSLEAARFLASRR
ncbi:MAG: ABC transporter permease subunit [Polyangiaceae bacterium]|nr:ABC transporter permease subunit [Polyangiaceae bacterium]